MVEDNTSNLHPYITPNSLFYGPLNKEQKNINDLQNSVNQQVNSSLETTEAIYLKELISILSKANEDLSSLEIWKKAQEEIPSLKKIKGVAGVDFIDNETIEIYSEENSITGKFELIDPRFKFIKQTDIIYIEENAISFVNCRGDFLDFHPRLTKETNITEITFESDGDTTFSAPTGESLKIGLETIKSGSITFNKDGNQIDEDFDHEESEVEVE